MSFKRNKRKITEEEVRNGKYFFATPGKIFRTEEEVSEEYITEMLPKEVTLYDPHPGFGGAMVPIPSKMKDFADFLDGKVMILSDALNQCEEEAEKIGGHVKLGGFRKFIGFYIGPHSYRLLRYK